MKVGEHHDIDVFVRQASAFEFFQQAVGILNDSESLLEFRLEEQAYSSLKKNVSLGLLDQQAAASQWDSIE